MSCDIKIHNGTDDSAVYRITHICGKIRHFGVGLLSIEMPQRSAGYHQFIEKHFGYIELTDTCLALTQTDIVTLETFGYSTTILMTRKSIPFVISIPNTWIHYTKQTSFRCIVNIFYQHMPIPSVLSVGRSCSHDEIQVYLDEKKTFFSTLFTKKNISYNCTIITNHHIALTHLGTYFIKDLQLDSNSIFRQRV